MEGGSCVYSPPVVPFLSLHRLSVGRNSLGLWLTCRCVVEYACEAHSGGDRNYVVFKVELFSLFIWVSF